MKYWKYLAPGDIVDVVAPSSFTSRENFKAGVAYLESLGLNINIENQTHIKKLEDRGIVR